MSRIRTVMVRRPVSTLVVLWCALVTTAALVGSQLDESTPFDRRISHWFVDRRTPRWNWATQLLSEVGSTFVVIAIVLVVVAFGAALQRPDGLVLLIIAMVGEITMFLTITLLVDRPRPDVPHLDSAPPTSSFPSGHTLATFVLWNSIAVVAVRADWPRLLRRISRILALGLPIAVGVSRISRGMHHATDVIASLLMGLAWVTAVAAVITPDVFEGRFRRLSASAATSPWRTSPQPRDRTKNASV